MHASLGQLRSDGAGALPRLSAHSSRVTPIAAEAWPHAKKVRVRIAHSVPLIAAGIRAVLARAGTFEMGPPASQGVADVLAADIDSALLALQTGVCRHVLIVAQDDGEAVIRKALAHGARGFVLHSCAAEELTMAVSSLASGGTAFAPMVASRLAQSLTSEPLTRREIEIVQLLVQGSSDKDMARTLSIALGTVKSHVRSILAKLGAARRAEAAAIAQRRGLARLDNLLAP